MEYFEHWIALETQCEFRLLKHDVISATRRGSLCVGARFFATDRRGAVGESQRSELPLGTKKFTNESAYSVGSVLDWAGDGNPIPAPRARPGFSVTRMAYGYGRTHRTRAVPRLRRHPRSRAGNLSGRG